MELTKELVDEVVLTANDVEYTAESSFLFPSRRAERLWTSYPMRVRGLKRDVPFRHSLDTGDISTVTAKLCSDSFPRWEKSNRLNKNGLSW